MEGKSKLKSNIYSYIFLPSVTFTDQMLHLPTNCYIYRPSVTFTDQWLHLPTNCYIYRPIVTSNDFRNLTKIQGLRFGRFKIFQIPHCCFVVHKVDTVHPSEFIYRKNTRKIGQFWHMFAIFHITPGFIKLPMHVGIQECFLCIFIQG